MFLSQTLETPSFYLLRLNIAKSSNSSLLHPFPVLQLVLQIVDTSHQLPHPGQSAIILPHHLCIPSLVHAQLSSQSNPKYVQHLPEAASSLTERPQQPLSPHQAHLLSDTMLQPCCSLLLNEDTTHTDHRAFAQTPLGHKYTWLAP